LTSSISTRETADHEREEALRRGGDRRLRIAGRTAAAAEEAVEQGQQDPRIDADEREAGQRLDAHHDEARRIRQRHLQFPRLGRVQRIELQAGVAAEQRRQ
jgi:hypothetical protein